MSYVVRRDPLVGGCLTTQQAFFRHHTIAVITIQIFRNGTNYEQDRRVL